jgi:hypothetical protein
MFNAGTFLQPLIKEYSFARPSGWGPYGRGPLGTPAHPGDLYVMWNPATELPRKSCLSEGLRCRGAEWLEWQPGHRRASGSSCSEQLMYSTQPALWVRSHSVFLIAAARSDPAFAASFACRGSALSRFIRISAA